MVQIKLSIAFVLAAAAIAPIVAHPILPNPNAGHPIREPEAGHEHEDRVGPHRHSHRHEHEHAGEVDGFPARHHHEHHEEPGHQDRHHFRGPQDPSAGSNSPLLSLKVREYFDEFDVRDLLSGQSGVVNSLEREEKTLESQDAKLQRQHQILTQEDGQLENKDRHLKHKEHYLKHKDHHLAGEDRKLKHERNSLETQDKALDGRKHRLEGEDKKLSATDKALSLKGKLLSAKDKKLALKGKGLAHKDKILGAKGQLLGQHDKFLEKKGKLLAHKDKALAKKGVALEHHDDVLKQEGKVLAHNDNVLAQKGKALESKVPSLKIPLGHGPVVHPKPEIVAREYAEFDDVFERALGDVESGSSTEPLFKSPARYRIGTVVRPRVLPSQRHPRFGLGVPRRGPFSSPFGHGPVELTPQRGPIVGRGGPHYGPRPEIPREPKLVTREYAEFDDMFERDLEDVEIDARDFDALYLD